jgi:GTPase-associated protein 1, N-terminal domain type 2
MTACPQLVYTSAGRTLEGPGFGVVAVSRGWPRSVGDNRSTLGALISAAAGADAVGLLHRGDGRIAYRKVPAASDDFGRSGNYLVQLLWDPDARMSARDVLDLYRSGGFLDALPAGAEPSRDAAPVAVPLGRRVVPALTADDVDALVPSLAVVLAAVEAGDGVVRLPERTASGRAVADLVFDVLPRALAAGVSVHVGTAETMGDTAPVQVLVGDHPQPVDRAPDGENCARARALLEAAAKSELVSDTVAGLGELDGWLFADEWMSLDAALLSDGQLTAVLAAPGAGRWLRTERNAKVAVAAAVDVPAVAAALTAVVDRDPAAHHGVRAVELDTALRAVFEGRRGRARTTDFAGLTQGELCAGFTEALARGRRLERIGQEAALLIEQTLALGCPLSLVELTGDTAGLAGLVARRPVVREAFLREWGEDVAAGRWSERHGALLANLLLLDADWFGLVAPVTPEAALRTALRRVAGKATARQVERLAVTIASSEHAGRGWALRLVLFPSGLPDEQVGEILTTHFALLARDDGWPRALATRTEQRLAADADAPADPRARRRRRG